MDIQVGTILNSGPYKNAKVLRISKNGWIRLQFNGQDWFSARRHWLQLEG